MKSGDACVDRCNSSEISTDGFFARIAGPFEVAWRGLDTWPDEERIINVMSDEDILTATIQTNVQGGLDPCPVWLVGDLVEVLFHLGCESVVQQMLKVFDESLGNDVTHLLSVEASVFEVPEGYKVKDMGKEMKKQRR